MKPVRATFDVHYRPAVAKITLVLPPRRSRLLNATGDGLMRATRGAPPNLPVIELSGAFDEAGNAVTVEYIGAEFRAPVELGADPVLEHAIGLDSINHVYHRFYCRRQALAEADKTGVQQFFFNVDRWTNEVLLQYANDVKDIPGRIQDIQLLSNLLWQRLEDRWNEKPLGKPSDELAAAIATCSVIFKSAAGDLIKDGWEKLAAALGDFATGALRQSIWAGMFTRASPRSAPDKDRREPQYWSCTDPDSYMIFLFAELANAGMDVPDHKEMWESLFPVTVKMQSYFLSRFMNINNVNLMDYGMPEQVLHPWVREQIDASYCDSARDRFYLERRMSQNMHAAGLSLDP